MRKKRLLIRLKSNKVFQCVKCFPRVLPELLNARETGDTARGMHVSCATVTGSLHSSLTLFTGCQSLVLKTNPTLSLQILRALGKSKLKV